MSLNQLVIHLMPVEGCAVRGGVGSVAVLQYSKWPGPCLNGTVPCPLCQGPDQLVAFLDADKAGAA